ncbi:MAG: aminotransferase class V-fold PLP-dependent enzyme [Gammaproteobacteria bacterium]|nr:aminotransferase class V-fold PLP-dependent enzyme [Gammaproteobacteria bacterium]
MPGRNALFVPGPTNIPERVRRAMSVMLEDHRSPSFPELSLPLFEDMKKIFKTKNGKVFLFPASGTGGWEAAMVNTLSPGDGVLQAVFGQFSLLWADMHKRWGLDVTEVQCEWGTGVPLDKYREILAADKAHKIKAVLVTHNETATGVTSDIKGVRDILDDLKHPALLYVDGVSSIASIEFDMDAWGVDLAISGSQKGLMLPTGLGIVAASEKALAAYDSAKLPRCFFDFQDMIKTNADGWFPYTPATTLLHGLREALNILMEEGMDNVVARHNRMASATRAAVDAWGLSLCAQEPKWHSDTVSAIIVPDGIDSADVVKHAYSNYDLSLGIGLNKVAGKVFRIGHLGDMNETMLLSGIGGAEMAMRDAGIKIEPGSGVGAASEYLRTTAGAAGQGKRAAA